ncbi:glycosyltransferase family 2 protein [Niallia taxi]|uniref:glycosyltransferase family A protein n=1 Tax=Niallia taxi TaxID=2499688 RepID=UPI0021A8D821|nr:glycosyltransferase family A protein [Niallia taxi]MCT2347454.1 glycosyltransferase family 2 protein [Niallia taxi]
MNIIKRLNKFIFRMKCKLYSKVKPIEMNFKLKYFKNSLMVGKGSEEKVIVSLTTIPSRINFIWIVITTLMDQKVKPKKIILWLDTDSFQDNTIPEKLESLQSLGLDIRFCDNIRSHKKYYYTLKEFPNDIIVTVDDDICYPRDFLSKLVDLNVKYPNDILCYRAHEMLFDENKQILPYNSWNSESPGVTGSSFLLVPTGVSGVLYPPSSLAPEVLNKEALLKLAPFCDDIWLKVMGIKQGTKVRKVNRYSKHFPIINETQKETLSTINVYKNNNDIELERLINKYNLNLAKLK